MKAWVWTIRVLLGVELVYVLATGVFLNGGFLTQLINTNAHELRIVYKFAVSPFPGRVWAYGVDVRVEDPALMMHFSLERAVVDISLPHLHSRQFHATNVSASGLVYRFMMKPTPKTRPQYVALLPPIPAVYEPKPPKKLETEPDRGPWTLRLENISISDFRELWFEGYRFLGDATLNGSFRLHPGQGAQVDRGIIQVKDGVVRMGEQKVADKIEATIDAHLEPFMSQGLEGLQLLRYLSASIVGTANIDGVDFLNHYLGKVPSVRLRGGRGPLVANLQIKDGTLQDGTTLTVDAQDLRADLWNQRLSGQAHIDWKAEAGLGTMNVDFDRIELRHMSQKTAKIRGNKLTLIAKTRDLDLVEPFQDLRVRIGIPEAKIDDLSYFEAYIPRGVGVRLVSGKGILSAWVEAVSDRLLPEKGSLSLAIKAFKAKVEDKQLTGDATVEGRLTKKGAELGVVDIAGSHISFERVFASTVGSRGEKPAIGWWGEVFSPEGVLSVEPAVAFKGKLTAHGRDARPLLSVFGAKAGIPSIVDGILSMDGLYAAATIDVDDDSMSILDAVAEGGSTKINGWLKDSGDDGRRGKLLLQYGPFAVGLDVDGQQTHFKLNDAIGWFADPPGAE